MVKNNFTASLLIVFIAAGFFKVDEIQAETRNAKISSQLSKTFNPFNMGSWLSLPSQFIQYWFPLFRPEYYPPYLQNPTTTSTPKTTMQSTASRNPTETTTENLKSKTSNIFGVSDCADDKVEYLPAPNEIEW